MEHMSGDKVFPPVRRVEGRLFILFAAEFLFISLFVCFFHFHYEVLPALKLSRTMTANHSIFWERGAEAHML